MTKTVEMNLRLNRLVGWWGLCFDKNRSYDGGYRLLTHDSRVGWVGVAKPVNKLVNTGLVWVNMEFSGSLVEINLDTMAFVIGFIAPDNSRLNRL